MTNLDLSALPAPAVIEELASGSVVTALNESFRDRWSIVRAENPQLELPEYDVHLLETDPVVILNQNYGYRDTVLRARINDAARANLLAFAEQGDLDHLAAFYDVIRMSGEDDARLKMRVILAIQGRSTGGTEPRYRQIALEADIRVTDAIVYTIGRSPVIHVAIFSSDPDGVADEALIAKVQAALQAPDKQMVNDTIVVRTAVRTVINIEANIWLLPDTPLSIITTMEMALRNAWDGAQALGRDFTSSWWTTQLMLDGVHRIEPINPIGDVIVPPDEAVSIGSVTLNFMGRVF